MREHVTGTRAMGADDGMMSTARLVLPLVVIFVAALFLIYFMPGLSGKQSVLYTGALGLLIICFLSTEIALYLLIFSMLLSPEIIVGSTAEASLGRGVTLRLDDFLLFAIGFSWVTKTAVQKQLGLFLRTPLNKPIAIYIGVCLVSTLLGVGRGNVGLKTGLLFVTKYFEFVLVFFMVANHLKDREQAKRFLWALLATGVLVSIIGIAQIPEGARISAPFEGEAGEPNTFGGYLVFLTCILSGLILNSSSVKWGLRALPVVALFIIPLAYTQSRASYLALVPGMLAFVVLSNKRQFVLLLVVLMCVLIPFLAPQPVKERIAYTFNPYEPSPMSIEIAGFKLDTSTSDRIRGWEKVAQDWFEQPFLGYGVTGHKFVDAQYFRILIETGIAGLCAFFFLIYHIYRQCYRTLKSSSGTFERGLAMGFLAGLTGLLAHGIGANTFIIVRIMEPFWFVLALVIVAPRLGTQTDGPANNAT